jgi:hypothetical protein
MAIVVIPNVYFLPEQEGHKAAEVRVAARTVDGIYRELAERFQALRRHLLDGEGNPRFRFELWRESDEEFVGNLADDTQFGADERLFLIDMVAC